MFKRLTIVFLLANGMVAQTRAQQSCSDTFNSCTAIDMDVTMLAASTIDTCTTPDDTFVLDLTVLLDPQGTTQRYDVALWSPVSATADIGNLSSADQCFANLINPDGHNLDGDRCNDVDGSGGGTVTTTQSFTLSCDWDGQPLQLVASWYQLAKIIPKCTEPTTTSISKCLAVTSVVVDVAVCGDGMFDPSEECDDGNKDDGDGCDPMCQIEQDIFKDGFEMLFP